MSELRFLLAQLVVVLPLAVVTWLAVAYLLYWHLWWLDIPMHFAGGMWAGLCGAWILVRRGQPFSLLWCLIFALLVGVGWEIFEYIEGITYPRHFGYSFDTAKDLVMDLLGAALGWFLAKRLIRKRPTLEKVL